MQPAGAVRTSAKATGSEGFRKSQMRAVSSYEPLANTVGAVGCGATQHTPALWPLRLVKVGVPHMRRSQPFMQQSSPPENASSGCTTAAVESAPSHSDFASNRKHGIARSLPLSTHHFSSCNCASNCA